MCDTQTLPRHLQQVGAHPASPELLPCGGLAASRGGWRSDPESCLSRLQPYCIFPTGASDSGSRSLRKEGLVGDRDRRRDILSKMAKNTPAGRRGAGSGAYPVILFGCYSGNFSTRNFSNNDDKVAKTTADIPSAVTCQPLSLCDRNSFSK